MATRDDHVCAIGDAELRVTYDDATGVVDSVTISAADRYRALTFELLDPDTEAVIQSFSVPKTGGTLTLSPRQNLRSRVRVAFRDVIRPGDGQTVRVMVTPKYRIRSG